MADEKGKRSTATTEEEWAVDPKEIDNWIRTKGKAGGAMACPMCGSAEWAYWPYVFRALQKPYSSPDFIEASCQRCGFIARFDAEVVGLVTPGA